MDDTKTPLSNESCVSCDVSTTHLIVEISVPLSATGHTKQPAKSSPYWSSWRLTSSKSSLETVLLDLMVEVHMRMLEWQLTHHD